MKVNMCRTLILPVVLYGYVTWPLTLREESGLRVFENRVPRNICGLKGDNITGNGENYMKRNFSICTSTKLYSDEQMEKNEMGGACRTYGGKGEVHRGS
jgi:hypothetical protein